MLRHIRATITAMAITGTLLTLPAKAAGCWESQAVNAAKIRDLQTMLMVGALRCRIGSENLLPVYNHFVNSNRSLLMKSNNDLRGHFSRTGGGERDYDRFTTSLANGYGAGNKGVSDCAELRDLATEAAMAKGNRDQLVKLAEKYEINPVAPRQQCRVKVAAR
jgi:hypothetical protein